MTSGPTAITCPCGGHVLQLAPGKPPVGGRAAFTCPACGLRRAFTRTETGAVFDTVAAETATVPPASAVPVATTPPDIPTPPARAVSGNTAFTAADSLTADTRLLPAPRTVPPEAFVVLAAVGEPTWQQAVETAFPAPRWHVLDAASDPDQNLADVQGLVPAVVVAEAGAPARELAGAIHSLTGRQRERLTFVVVGELTEGDPMTAFAAGADAVLDSRCDEEAADRLARAVSRRNALPSLFATPR